MDTTISTATTGSATTTGSPTTTTTTTPINLCKPCPPVMSPPDLPPVPPNRCASYQSSKKRYCKGRPLPPSLYCGNHKHLDFDEKEYVECPIGCGNVFMKQR